MMKIRSILSLIGASSLLTPISQAQGVLFSDDFNDNTLTGWTFLDRNGVEEIANASWLEVNDRLEQQTQNYDFTTDSEDRPALGAIALAPKKAGGHYQLSVSLISLEPGNNFQDEDLIFAYVDVDNFYYIETIRNFVSLFQVTAGERVLIDRAVATFLHDSVQLTMEHDSVAGRVVVTYGGGVPLEFTGDELIIAGENSVGVGSNNDAFAIDDFTITSVAPSVSVDLEITALTQNAANGGNLITWISELDVEYIVEKSVDLITWIEVDDAVGEVGSTTVLDAASGGIEKIFYRVRTGG